MKKIVFLIVTFTILILGCSKPKVISIDRNTLLNDVKVLAHDSLSGRAFSKEGNLKAQQFILRSFQEIGLAPYFGDSLLQKFNYNFSGRLRQRVFPIEKPLDDLSNVTDTLVGGANIVGMIKGKQEKSIVITAHFDHLGVKNEKIYNGADDNASGTAALFTIARYFKNKNPNHHLIFAAVDGKEVGSLGAKHFLKYDTKKQQIKLNINMDMIAHSDYDPILFASGLHHFPELRDPLEAVESEDILFLFGHDDPDHKEQSDWTFSSDHSVFYKEGIPFIYFGVPDHKDYHRASDTYETINEDFYVEAVKIIISAIEHFDRELIEN
ncbi:M28 family peptidase [Polaribacter sp.]|uniref:M28 family peptidase n=1 Tax=Polaribacter sp. TaxID=1920175 RepID=UPI003F69E5C7